MKKYAVIVAGGAGVRMGSVLPKQFLLIHQKPVLWYTLQVFLKSYKDIQIILVLPAEFMETGRLICEDIHHINPIQLVVGGPTRFHSVQNGLSLVTGHSVVFVHDAVRCLLSSSLIHLCFDSAVRFGSAIPGIESKDTVRILENQGSRTIDRRLVRIIQTPQTFLSDLLIPAYQLEYRAEFTDDASVVEASGGEIHLVEGEVNNIKITTPLDLEIAERLLDLPKFPA